MRSTIDEVLAWCFADGIPSCPPMRQRAHRAPLPDAGFVYFAAGVIDGQRAIKIGFSRNPEKRMLALRSRFKIPVQLLRTQGGTQEDERSLHRHFRASWIRNEWFRETAEVVNYIGPVDGFYPEPTEAPFMMCG